MITSLSIQILFVWFFIVYFLREKLRKRGLLLIFAISWFFFWNLLSTFSISGINSPKQSTQFIYFLFYLSLLLGVYLDRGSENNKSAIHPDSSESVEIIEQKYFQLLKYFVVPVMVSFLIRTIYLLKTKYSIAQMRAEVFGLNTGTSDLFYRSISVTNFYWLVMHPILWASLLIGFVRFIRTGKLNILMWAIVLFVVDSLTTIGRFGIHYAIISLVTMYGLYLIKDSISSKRKIYVGLLSSVLIFILIFIMIQIRKGNSLEYIFGYFLLGYHTNSFALFDMELHNPNSLLYDYTFGLSFFSGLFELPIFLLNSFLGFSIQSISGEIGSYLNADRLVGHSEILGDLYYNAFGSNFFVMFRDGGPLFVGIYGLLFGFLYSKFSSSLKESNPLYSTFLIGMYYILIYGIFKPFTTGEILPGILIAFLIYKIPEIFIFRKK
ncbi:oligosaccharide repeat unit polymerase [Leptospira montravelensis]|uniref:Oligosaccharide repeat unit polymerase n=1 Tax=Leptospira montravelensis TaxID=2484961 RepID=A0ABY2LXE1_9LEPT|nr:oligosaccharide repeat unit polymerase [Leptospira montravelensis]TGL05452.1 oligosaccharide repeat unit polymerase [Leptospira montravelensis]